MSSWTLLRQGYVGQACLRCHPGLDPGSGTSDPGSRYTTAQAVLLYYAYDNQSEGRFRYFLEMLYRFSFQEEKRITGYVYILTDKRNGTLYVGVTSNLGRRLLIHRAGKKKKRFTCRYGLTRLVYFEISDDILVAIRREKQLKGWRREWKTQLIDEFNSQWDDLTMFVLGYEDDPRDRYF